MHEILTLQLGHRANHVCTHFWNIQESYFSSPSSSLPTCTTSETHIASQDGFVNHDIHWREGIDSAGRDTYTPRTLIYDLRAGFGGGLNWPDDDGGMEQKQEPSEAGNCEVWNGSITTIRQPPPRQSDYHLALGAGLIPPKLRKEAVTTWSDYNRILYHPRSLHPMNPHELISSLSPFEKWTAGEDLFSRLNHQDDSGDSVIDGDFRTWAEECDAIQGVQVFGGTDDAWGGFGAKYVEGLRDEFGLKSAIWIWGLEEGFGKNDTKAKQMQRKVNSANSLYSLSEHASMYIPLSFPTIPSSSLPKSICREAFDRESLWHTSALLATVMESISLPSRLHQLGGNTSGSRAGFLNSIEAALNVNGNQNISSVQMSIANPATLQKRNEEQMSNLDERGGKSDDRMGMQGRSNTEIDRPATDSHAAKLDIDFLPPWSDGFLRRASHHDHGHSNRRHHCYDHETSREHIFSQVETLRGLGMSGIGAIGGHNEGGRQEELFDNRTNRMQRRLAALPILEKYPTPLLFPLLSSFPSEIFLPESENHHNMAVHTALSTTSIISSQIKGLGKGLARGMMMLEEKESVTNGLAEIAEAYEVGWQSGDEADDDSDG